MKGMERILGSPLTVRWAARALCGELRISWAAPLRAHATHFELSPV